MDTPLEFFRTFWHVFAMMAPWLIIGFFVARIMARNIDNAKNGVVKKKYFNSISGLQ